MEYLDSTHFSDKISYKILFISSYGSKDMNLPRFAYLQEFQKTEEKKTARAETGPDLRRRIVSATRQRRMRSELAGRGPSMRDLNKTEEKGLACTERGSNSEPATREHGTDQQV
jgi:hypothetical protein